MAAQEPNGDLERLLTYLKKTRGFDFSAYKRSTLSRRIQKRMAMRNCDTFDEYLDYLEVHPDEFQHLFNTILINVTSFFRDSEAWEYLREQILPKVIDGKDSDQPVRVWVAGCASGEEAYTTAIALAEAMGMDSFRERVKIYATDVDDDALNHSRVAAYTPKDLEGLPQDLVERYFEFAQDRYVFDREVRRSVIFGRHDLISDAPISKVDLLLCRNTLMYFNAEAQERILARFHFALADSGYLFLGKAETLLTHASLFIPVNLRCRVFAKAPRGRLKDRAHLVGNGGNGHKPELEPSAKLREMAYDATPVPQIVIDLAGKLAMANDSARALFGISGHDVGKLIQDLEISYRPIELRSGIDQAYELRRPVQFKDIRWSTPNGDTHVLEVKIAPLVSPTGELLGSSIFFDDVTQYKRLQEDLENFNQELETAYEEVQSTNEELQTTNEELQSTVEELETTNEELQSTNEELETINEELQSTNEELETINEELRKRSDELNEANAFLESILAGLRDGVIVVDKDLEVLAWNAKSEDMWGLRADEVRGKHLLNLDISLPLDQMRNPLRNSMSVGKPEVVELKAVNRRGRMIGVRTTIAPLDGALGDLRGAIVLVEEIEDLPV